MRIEVRGARLKLGNSDLFDALSANFPSSSLTALVGPSGSGKSTLLGLMAGYGRLDEGEVKFVDEQGYGCPPKPELIAWVPQGANALGNRSVIDNVMIGPLANGFNIDESLLQAQSALDDVGMASNEDQAARALSGGQLQRLGFARALASRRPIIFADEPSASLDSQNTHNIARLLLKLRRRATIVVATHDPALLEAADHVVMLRPER